jgi:hypothetical protein
VLWIAEDLDGEGKRSPRRAGRVISRPSTDLQVSVFQVPVMRDIARDHCEASDQ